MLHCVVLNIYPVKQQAVASIVSLIPLPSFSSEDDIIINNNKNNNNNNNNSPRLILIFFGGGDKISLTLYE